MSKLPLQITVIVTAMMFGASTAGVAARNAISTTTQFIDNDDQLTRNWMVDRQRQMLLKKPAALNNLNKLRHRDEAKLQAAIETSSDDAGTLACRLLNIYELLELPQEAKKLVMQLEATDNPIFQPALEQYYLKADNKPKLAQVLQRIYDRKKAKLDWSWRCADLVRLGDLYYQIGNMARAEQNYKEAVTIASKFGAKTGLPGDGPNRVHLGAMNAYACFLADRGRLDEAVPLMEKLLYFYERHDQYQFEGGYGAGDDLGTFLVIIEKKDPKLYQKLYRRWRLVNGNTPYAGLLSNTGKELTGPQFKTVSAFSEGLAVAQDQFTYRYGYIDKTGKWKIQPRYINANPFSKGIATAKLATAVLPLDCTGQFTTFSLIDSQGNEIKKLPDLDVGPFVGNVCIGQRENAPTGNGISDIIERSGEILFSGTFGAVRTDNKDQWTLFFTTGHISAGCLLTPVGYEIDITVKPDKSRPGHFQLVQRNLKPYKNGTKLPEEALLWGRNENSATNNKYKFAAKYQEVRPFSEGLAAFRLKDRWGFVNAEGKEVIPAKYDEVGDFHEGVTVYKRKLSP